MKQKENADNFGKLLKTPYRSLSVEKGVFLFISVHL